MGECVLPLSFWRPHRTPAGSGAASLLLGWAQQSMLCRSVVCFVQCFGHEIAGLD